VVVRNTGRKPAENLRVGHTILPDDFIVQPDMEYTIKELPGGSKELVFPIIPPKKQITISYLYFPPLTYDKINSHVESDNGAAKPVNVLLQPVFSKWVNASVWVLMLLGMTTIMYLLVQGALWLTTM
jgi:hypothetical protein